MSEDSCCPLCTNEFDDTDKNFKPCKCGYQVSIIMFSNSFKICCWCWNKIMETSTKCPNCRSYYKVENLEFKKPKKRPPADKKQTKKRRPRRPSLKSLVNVRVIQRNLVYIVGLTQKVAVESFLQSNFAKYGKIQKIVINKSNLNQTSKIHNIKEPTVSAYVTYYRNNDAKKAIAAIDGTWVDGKMLRCSYGTTKYCSYFLRGIKCTNPECMYLHEIGYENDTYSRNEIVLRNGLPLPSSSSKGSNESDKNSDKNGWNSSKFNIQHENYIWCEEIINKMYSGSNGNAKNNETNYYEPFEIEESSSDESSGDEEDDESEIESDSDHEKVQHSKFGFKRQMRSHPNQYRRNPHYHQQRYHDRDRDRDRDRGDYYSPISPKSPFQQSPSSSNKDALDDEEYPVNRKYSPKSPNKFYNNSNRDSNKYRSNYNNRDQYQNYNNNRDRDHNNNHRESYRNHYYNNRDHHNYHHQQRNHHHNYHNNSYHHYNKSRSGGDTNNVYRDNNRYNNNNRDRDSDRDHRDHRDSYNNYSHHNRYSSYGGYHRDRDRDHHHHRDRDRERDRDRDRDYRDNYRDNRESDSNFYKGNNYRKSYPGSSSSSSSGGGGRDNYNNRNYNHHGGVRKKNLNKELQSYNDGYVSYEEENNKKVKKKEKIGQISKGGPKVAPPKNIDEKILPSKEKEMINKDNKPPEKKIVLNSPVQIVDEVALKTNKKETRSNQGYNGGVKKNTAKKEKFKNVISDSLGFDIGEIINFKKTKKEVGGKSFTPEPRNFTKKVNIDKNKPSSLKLNLNPPRIQKGDIVPQQRRSGNGGGKESFSNPYFSLFEPAAPFPSNEPFKSSRSRSRFMFAKKSNPDPKNGNPTTSKSTTRTTTTSSSSSSKSSSSNTTNNIKFQNNDKSVFSNYGIITSNRQWI